MSKVNWDENAQDAIEEYRDWMMKNGKKIDVFLHQRFLKEVIERRPAQTKTVEDAVESLDAEWTTDDDEYCSYSGEYDEFFTHISSYQHRNGEHLVCTREQFEACAAEKGEKWTHIVETTSKKCKLLTKEPDSDGYYAIISSNGNYDIEHSDFIKPIKPTISESEAIGILKINKHLSFSALLEDYNVVKD